MAWSAMANPDFAHNPINSFQMLKRTSFQAIQITQQLKDALVADQALEILQPPDAIDFQVAGLGIVQMQLRHNLSCMDLVFGKVQDPLSGKIHQAAHNLTLSDTFHLTEAAVELQYFKLAVEWSETSLFLAKTEKQPQDIIKNCRRNIKKYKGLHDDVIVNHGWMHWTQDKRGDIITPIVNDKPFNERVLHLPRVRDFLKEKKRVFKAYKMYQNKHQEDDFQIRHFVHAREPQTTSLCRGQVGTNYNCTRHDGNIASY